MSGLTATTVTTDSLVGSTSANAITVRGEGTATTSLQQGLCKSWLDYKANSPIAILDSFNVSGVVDNGTGDCTKTFSSAMNTSNYPTQVSGGSGRAGSATVYWGGYNAAPTTTAARVKLLYGSGTAGDTSDVCTATQGDLA